MATTAIDDGAIYFPHKSITLQLRGYVKYTILRHIYWMAMVTFPFVDKTVLNSSKLRNTGPPECDSLIV